MSSTVSPTGFFLEPLLVEHDGRIQKLRARLRLKLKLKWQLQRQCLLTSVHQGMSQT